MAEGAPDFERGGDQTPPEQVRYQQISARVPEHASRGVFSTGALVMTGANEFVLDFVLRAMRPHQIVARVVLPHAVMPQLLRVLNENIQKYQQRFGTIPPVPGQRGQAAAGRPGQAPGAAPPGAAPGEAPVASDQVGAPAPHPPDAPAPGAAPGGGPGAAGPAGADPGDAGMDAGAGGSGRGGESGPAPGLEAPGGGTPPPPLGEPASPAQPPQPPIEQVVQPGTPSEPRRPSVEEIYGDLKLPDELLSGVYANAVMISHSPGAFSFDFLTSFYPRSAVSARVFLPAPHVPALLDSMSNTWQHLQMKLQQARQRRRDEQGGGGGASPGQ